MILSQAFLWQSGSGTESKCGHSVVPEPSHVASISQLWDVGDMAPNATSKCTLELSPGPKSRLDQDSTPRCTSKCTLELSPGPKSPLASHTQKHTKDDFGPG